MNTIQPQQDHLRVHEPLSCSLGTSDKLPRLTQNVKTWRGVFFEGPESAHDQEGEEIPVWFVYVGDENADPLGKVYRCYSFPMAERLARRMAKDRHLELIQEAMPA